MDEKLDELLGILARLAEDRGPQAEQARRLYRDELIPHLEADGARGFGQAVERIWQVSKRVPCNPFDTGCLPLSCSEIPGVKWRI